MKPTSSYNFSNILSRFCIEGELSEASLFGSGHINNTFHIKNSNQSYPDYLLQRINNYVFKDVAGLTANVKLVIEHLRKKVESVNGDLDTEVLTLIPTKDGLYYYKDEEGNYWRVYYYLKNTRSYDLPENELQAYEGGKAFGKFQAMLSDMDAGQLVETIPDFHNIEYRLSNFDQALDKDPMDRAKECREEIAFINERREKMCTILRMGREGKLPLRITHNDTKFNNVLLNREDKAQCVIDLDTVMPGYTAYDFGDSIRTIINTADEDEKDLSKVDLNIDLFKAYTRGFLTETIRFLTDSELQSLIYGALLLPYIQAVRFLTDHLDGDKYFKINFPGHNLQRTRAQLQLLRKLEEKQQLLESIIYEVADSYKASRSGVTNQ